MGRGTGWEMGWGVICGFWGSDGERGGGLVVCWCCGGYYYMVILGTYLTYKVGT